MPAIHTSACTSRAARLLVALATVALLAGLSAGAALAAPANPKQMVLQLADLPAGFSLKDGHYVSNARSAKESDGASLADYLRWGRITGYEAEFSREAITGIISLTSAASTYRTVKGAAASTRDSYTEAGKQQELNGKPVVFRRVSTGAKLGHEARMFSARLENDGIAITIYAVVWRYRTVKATLLVGGLAATVDAADVVQLAQKQQKRIAAELR